VSASHRSNQTCSESGTRRDLRSLATKLRSIGMELGPFGPFGPLVGLAALVILLVRVLIALTSGVALFSPRSIRSFSGVSRSNAWIARAFVLGLASSDVVVAVGSSLYGFAALASKAEPAVFWHALNLGQLLLGLAVLVFGLRATTRIRGSALASSS
jgi:hypothetical protein